MKSSEIRTLLQEAVVAADARQLISYDAHDLRFLLGKLAVVAEDLLDDRDELERRLWRSPGRVHPGALPGAECDTSAMLLM